MIAILTLIGCLADKPTECVEFWPENVPASMTMQECVLLGQQIAVLMREGELFVEDEGGRYILRKWRCTPGQDA